MKIICVSGSVGSGKTSLAKKLAKKIDYAYIDVNDLIKKDRLFSGYDRKKGCYIVDVDKLNKSLIRIINNHKKSIKETNKIKKKSKKFKRINGIIIDSHLSHYLPKKYVDLSIVTKCGLKVLKNRLEKRNYGKAKIRENLDCEIFDVCFEEAKEKKHKILLVDTTKGINIKGIIQQIK